MGDRIMSTSGRRQFSSRHLDLVVGALLLYTLVAGLWEASMRPFWYDEIFTVVLAGLPAMSDIVEALTRATDTSGPMYYVFVRAVSGLLPNLEITFRLPSLLATAVACGAVYLFARRDLGAVAGSVAVLVMLVTPLYHGFSVEARPYALMVMFICIAAVAWQRAASRWWTVVLGVSAALAVATHYYSVFAGVPFVLAEAVRSVRCRRIRVGVWAALAMGAVSLAAVWPILAGLRGYYGEHYWSKPTIGKAMATYDWALVVGLPGAGFGLALALGLAMLLLFIRLWPRDEDLAQRVPAPETLVLVMSLLALPFVAAGVTRVMGGGFADRYALGLLAGIGLSVAYAVRALDERKQTLAALALASMFCTHELVFWATGGAVTGRMTRPPIQAHWAFIEEVKEAGLPVVVDNSMDCLALAFYKARESGVEVVCLTDPEAARRYIGTDSLDLDLIALHRYFKTNIVDFDTFRQRHPRFMLLANFGSHSWWPTRLFDDKFRLSVVSRSSIHAVYLVEAPQ